MIVLRNVSKVYPSGKEAISGVTFAVPKDDFVFIVGPNGAGKSTLLRLLSREERASSGCILVNGHDLQQLSDSQVPQYRQQIGIVFQDIRLFPDRTVYENVAISLHVAARRPGNTRALVMEALEQVELENHARRLPGELSGGEQQRTAIARAIVRRPAILIADEPTANLPPRTGWQIMGLLREITARGVTSLIATHDRDVVDGMRRRVVELADGRIVRDERTGTYGE